MSLQGYPLVGVPFVSVINETNSRDYPLLGVLLDSFVDVNIAITGVTGTGAAGTATISISTGALTGVAGTGGVGTVGIFSGTEASIAGVVGTGGVGTAIAEVDASVTGQAATAQLGTVIPSTPILVNLTGQEATAALGTVTPEIDMHPSGQQATASIGTITWEVDAYTNVNGVAATAAYTAPFAISGPNHTSVNLTGQHATAGLGVPHASIAHTLTGQAGIAQIGTPMALATVGGMQMNLLECAEPHDATDIQVCLRWSDTYGESWAGSLHQSMGAKGAYLTNLQFRRLGLARNRVFEVSWSAPSPTALQGITLQFEQAKT